MGTTPPLGADDARRKGFPPKYARKDVRIAATETARAGEAAAGRA